MDGQKDTLIAQAEKPSSGLYNDLDMRPVAVAHNSAGKAEDDFIARPPRDPLSTGQKVAGLLDAGGSLLGSYKALSRFRDDGLHVLRADIKSLEKLANTPELREFRELGSTLSNKVAALNDGATADVINLQAAKPQLFDNLSNRGVWKGLNIKVPRYDMMNISERAVIDRSADLGYIQEGLRRGVNTSSTENFKSGLVNLHNLRENPTAISEGLSPELGRIESLGATVREQVAKSTVNMGTESRMVLGKNMGIVGLGLATNYVIEQTLLKDSSPKALTIATDVAAPFVVLSELPLWAKFSVIVGAHAAARLAEYGMSK